MKSTHWSVTDDPKDWTDDPFADPVEAVRDYITNDDCRDAAWDSRDEIMTAIPDFRRPPKNPAGLA